MSRLGLETTSAFLPVSSPQLLALPSWRQLPVMPRSQKKHSMRINWRGQRSQLTIGTPSRTFGLTDTPRLDYRSPAVGRGQLS
jgi:hypothetical protein